MHMPHRLPVLIVAATPRELAPSTEWGTLICGAGPVEAAATTAAALSAAAVAGSPYRAVVNIGIAGARRATGPRVGSVVLGSASHYDDLELPPQLAPREVQPNTVLLGLVQDALPEAVALPIATIARVGASHSAPVEAMEGFAVLRAAQRAGVPALEVRVIANEIEEQDRGRWAFDEAFAACCAVTPRVVAAISVHFDRVV